MILSQSISCPRAAASLALLASSLAAQEWATPLDAAVAVLPYDSAPFQRLLDFDGDGDLDAVGTRVFTDGLSVQVAVWRNDQGAFTNVLTQIVSGLGGFTGTPPRSLAVATGDFDVDGRDDFIVSGGSGTMQFLSLASGWQSTLVPVSGTPRMHGAAAGDFDGDGIDDFAIAVREVGGLRIEMHRSGGTPVSLVVPSTFGDPHLSVAHVVPGSARQLLLDERNATTSQAWVVRLQGSQIVVHQQLATSVPTGLASSLWMAGDLEGDGDDDVVMFRKGTPSARYQVFRNTAGLLSAEPVGFGGPAEYLADVDGDGDLDGVCCSSGGTTYLWPKLNFRSNFEVAINNGAGFANAFQFPGYGSESLAGAADIDGDGDVDFVAGRCVYYGRGPTVAAPAQAIPTMTGQFGGAYTLIERVSTQALSTLPLFQDVDGDGDPDVHTWTADWINRGDGTFQPTEPFASIPAPLPGLFYTFAAYADLDGDGNRDAIVRSFNSVGILQGFIGARNNGAGHFDALGPLCVAPTGATSFTSYGAADLDGDGDEDLIANDISLYVSDGIYWNDGGVLVPGPGFTTTVRQNILQVADFDSDGINDVVVSDYFAGLQVCHGTGDHQNPFVAQAILAASLAGPHSIAVGDINGDGRPDILATGPNSAPCIYINTTAPGGNITFAASILPFQYYHAVAIGASIADFDGDGRQDLAFYGFYDEPYVGVIALQQGNASLPTSTDFRYVRQLFDGFATDVDGDGDADLVGELIIRSPKHSGIAAGRRIQDIGGSVGEGGSTPRLSARGPFRVGETEQVLLRGVYGPGAAVLGFSGAPANIPNVPFPGTTLLVDPTNAATLLLFLPQSSDGRGASSTTMSVTIPPPMAGVTAYSQCFVYDPTVPAGVTCSNRMVQTFGF